MITHRPAHDFLFPLLHSGTVPVFLCRILAPEIQFDFVVKWAARGAANATAEGQTQSEKV